MCKATLSSLILTCFLLGAKWAFAAQPELSPEDFGLASVAVIVLDSTNQVRTGSSELPFSQNEALQQRWLLSETVRAELDLTADQVAQVQRAGKRFATLESLFTDAIRIELEPPRNQERLLAAGRKIRAERDSIADELNEILIPVQKRRLAQLTVRQSLVETGIEAALRGPARDKFGFAEKDEERWQTKLQELRAAADELRTQQHAEMVAEIESVLTREQQQRLQARLGDLTKYFAPAMEILACQLGRQNKPESPLEDGLEELLNSTNAYRVALDGQVESHPLPVGGPFTNLWELCWQKNYGRVELVDFQRRPEESDEDSTRRGVDLNKAIKVQANKLTAGEISFNDFIVEQNALILRSERARAEAWFKGLLPEQRDEVDRIVYRRLVSERGLHACLSAGALGEEISLSDAQREQIAALARERSKTILTSAQRMEARIWSEFGKVAAGNEAAAKAFREAVGPNPTFLAGNPDLLLRTEK